METAVVYWVFIGTVENKMETATQGVGFRPLKFEA